MKLLFTGFAQHDLQRLRTFLEERNPSAARRAATRIKSATASLRQHPLLGHPVLTPEGDEREEIRDLIVPFGARGYRIRYQVLPGEVRVLRVWHAREDVDETSR